MFFMTLDEVSICHYSLSVLWFQNKRLVYKPQNIIRISFNLFIILGWWYAQSLFRLLPFMYLSTVMIWIAIRTLYSQTRFVSFGQPSAVLLNPSSQQPASTGSWAITECLYLWGPSSRHPWGVSKGQEKSLSVQTVSIGFKGYCSPNWSQSGSVTCIMTSSPWEKRMRGKKNSC